mmetsp:Transcript_44096/g.44766  ORF Transcript_44096/g.44766 Transcript_44096/m.44766 type:complete len:141 (-) Transcript_44096:213-635(-)
MYVYTMYNIIFLIMILVVNCFQWQTSAYLFYILLHKRVTENQKLNHLSSVTPRNPIPAAISEFTATVTVAIVIDTVADDGSDAVTVSLLLIIVMLLLVVEAVAVVAVVLVTLFVELLLLLPTVVDDDTVSSNGESITAMI